MSIMIYQHNWQKAADLQHEDFASDRKQVRKNSYNSDASDDKQSLLPFSSCHSTAGMQVASDEDSIASFGAGQMDHVAPTDHAMFNKYSLHKSQSLLGVLEFQAALRIQGFFRRAVAWYKQETSRLQVEKMDVLRRQKEELETIQLLLDMEKQKARMELREDEEGKSVSTPDDSSKTFAWSYFASLKNHRNELRLGTKGYLELKRQIDSLTLQKKQFEGLVELGKRAMVKAKTEVAKAGAQLQKETAKKEKVQDCIVKVVNLLRASNDDRLAKKVLGSAREVLPNKLEEALQSIDETRPVKTGKPRSATLLGKAANDAAKEAHSSVRKSTRSRRSSDTTLVTTAKAKELKCEMDWEKRRRVSMNKKPMRRQRSKSCSSMPKLHRSKTAESQSKRNILRRQNSRSCSNVNGDANEDPAPLLSLIESAYSGATTKESQPRRKSLRRQRSKSYSDVHEAEEDPAPLLSLIESYSDDARASESQTRRKSFRRQRSKSYSDVNETAKDDPAPLLSLIEMSENVSASAQSWKTEAATEDPAPLLSLIEMNSADRSKGAPRKPHSYSCVLKNWAT